MTGWINGIGDDPDVPTHEFFYMGGDGLTSSIPLRGYDDPYSGSWATSSGGRVAMKFSTEFRVQILPNPTMYGLIFAEAGETWHQIEDTDPLSMRRSVGIGARLFMPMVGILGFDYAYGFDYFDANGNRYGKWMPHFVLGKGF
ncbi:BamA/TamA family outer membrane protein [bacterium]|nr:BamA/TamA family outer membrane protein [bacterium]